MQEEPIVVFRTFENAIQANIARGKLEANGIPCFLSDENLVTLNPLYSQALGGIKLQLFARDAEAAENILTELYITTDDDAGNGNIHCPKCESNNVSYGQSTDKPFSFLSVIISLLLVVYPFSPRMMYHCFTCGFEFEGKKE